MIIEKLIGSFDTKADNGFSARKLTAFVLVVCIVLIHIKYLIWGSFDQMEMVLTIDYTFVATLFGMTTYQSIKTPKNDNKQDNIG